MSRRFRTLGSAIVLSVAATVPAVAAASPAVFAATAVRVMPLGDSITAGPGCWRPQLWNRLQTSGYSGIDFVGTQSDGGGCNPGYSYDFDHEGHGGYSATGIADNNQLPPWLAAARPDVVLMHLGTNDMWGGYIPLPDKLTAFTKLIGQMRAANPAMKVVVAQIIPMSAAACATCPADVVALNNAIPGWAAGLSTAQSPIAVADLWTGYDAVADNSDGVHPTDTGFQKMADAWYPAVARILGGAVPTTLLRLDRDARLHRRTADQPGLECHRHAVRLRGDRPRRQLERPPGHRRNGHFRLPGVLDRCQSAPGGEVHAQLTEADGDGGRRRLDSLTHRGRLPRRIIPAADCHGPAFGSDREEVMA